MIPSIWDLEKMSPQWDHSRIMFLKYEDQVQEKSRRLYTAVNMSIDISNAILDLVRELEQLRQERV